jgi:hypothetical protein
MNCSCMYTDLAFLHLWLSLSSDHIVLILLLTFAIKKKCICDRYLEFFLANCIFRWMDGPIKWQIRVITKLPNSEMTDAALSLFHIASRWDPPCTPFSSTNKTDRQYITEILLKVGLNTITLTNNPIMNLSREKILNSFKKNYTSFLSKS